jgi:hypothetical protein
VVAIMPKLLFSQSIIPDSSAVAIVRERPNVAQVSFFVGTDQVHYVVMSRSDLEKIGRDIERELKASSLPSDSISRQFSYRPEQIAASHGSISSKA